MDKNKYKVFNAALRTVMRYFRIFVVAALALIAVSGVYRVESNEVAVVLRFGSLLGHTYEEQVKEPGLHFALPFIVDEVIKVPVGKVQELTITTHCGSGAAISPNIKINGYVITGDSNIVLVKTKVKYTVGDPVAYALYQSDVECLIDGVVSGEVTAIVAGMDVDSVLTSGKAQLASEVMRRSQELLDQLDCGVDITNIEFTEVNPPAETKSQFDNVNIAAVQKETAIQTARETASVTLLEAEARSEALIQEARSKQSELLTRAYNEVAEFDGLLGQYRENPNAVMDGVFRLRVADVLARMGATVVVPEGGSPTVILP